MNFSQIRQQARIGNHHHQMTNELPYLYFDDEKNIFINTTSVGFGLHLKSLGGANDETVENLNKILCSLPEGKDWDYQFHLKSTNRVGKALEQNYKASAVLGGLFETFADNEKIYATYAAKHGFNSRYGDTCKFDLREYETSFFVSNRKGSVEKLCDLMESLNVSFNQVGIKTIPYQPVGIIHRVRDTLNFSRSATSNPDYEYNELEEIYRQCLAVDSEFIDSRKYLACTFTNDRYKKETGRIITYGLQQLPNEFYLYRLPNCFADITQASRALTCPFELSVSFKIKDTSAESIENEQKIRSCEKWINSPMGRLMPHLADEIQDRKSLQKGLQQNDCKVAQMSFSLSLFTDKDNFKKDGNAAENAFLNESLRIVPNDMSHNVCLLSTLPFMGSDGFFDDLEKLGLVRTIKTSNLTNFIPVVTDPYSIKLGLLLPTFRRSLYFFDPFTAGGDNFNMAIAASSGSGKSFLTQAIVKSIIGRNGAAWIMDKGDSYWKLTKMFGGVYLNHKDIYLNPFTHLDKIAMGEDFIDDNGEKVNPLKQVISDIVALIGIMASPTEKLTPTQKTALLLAVDTAYRKHGSQTLIDHVQSEVEEIAIERDDRSISNLAFQLSPYVSTGIHGDIFNKPSKLDPTSKLTCLELDGFKGDLLQPVVFALIVNINQAMYLSGDRTTPKLCIIEEAWKLMSGKDETAAEFIEEGYRTARKFKGSFCAVTQSVDDYFKSSGAEAAYNNADIHILLRQGKGFTKYVQENPKAFTPYEVNMLKNFPTAKQAGFSSLMLQVGGQSSFHRFFADPITRAMLSTEAEEFEEVSLLDKQGYHIEEAVMTVAKKYYAGDIASFDVIKREAHKIQAEQENSYEMA
ncbi:type IV secretion system protein TraC [Vibrio fluvialis]|nr:type IV secretion system protein TraC [Vibrio fluvialis]